MSDIPRPMPNRSEADAQLRAARYKEVRTAIADLDRLSKIHGRAKAHLMLLTGFSSEMIDDLGGISADADL